MRWDLLFDDLESQLDQEQRDEERALALEEERLRIGRLTLRERIAALARDDSDSSPAYVRIELVGGRTVSIRPLLFGRDWVSAAMLDTPRSGAQCIIPIAAIAAILPARDRLSASIESAPESSNRLAERIGLPFVLRDLSRRRTPVHVTGDSATVHGTIDRVARDHLDLAMHEPGAPRREHDVTGYRIVPFAQMRLVSFR